MFYTPLSPACYRTWHDRLYWCEWEHDWWFSWISILDWLLQVYVSIWGVGYECIGTESNRKWSARTCLLYCIFSHLLPSISCEHIVIQFLHPVHYYTLVLCESLLLFLLAPPSYSLGYRTTLWYHTVWSVMKESFFSLRTRFVSKCITIILSCSIRYSPKIACPGTDVLDISCSFLALGHPCRSRLGCQVKVSAEHEGMVIKIPEDSIDMRWQGIKSTWEI